MELYRRSNVFEHLLSIIGSPMTHTAITGKIMEILFRCTYVNGSTTLVTRYSITTWIALSLVGAKDKLREQLHLLAETVQATCDQVRVEDWSDQSIKATLKKL